MNVAEELEKSILNKNVGEECWTKSVAKKCWTQTFRKRAGAGNKGVIVQSNDRAHVKDPSALAPIGSISFSYVDQNMCSAFGFVVAISFYSSNLVTAQILWPNDSPIGLSLRN